MQLNNKPFKQTNQNEYTNTSIHNIYFSTSSNNKNKNEKKGRINVDLQQIGF